MPGPVQQLCRSLYQNINGRAAALAPQWVIASIALDLRLKNKLLVCDELKNLSEVSLKSLYNTFDSKKLFGADQDEVIEQNQAVDRQSPLVHTSIQDLLKTRVAVASGAARSETERFLSIETGIEHDADPLMWWKEHANNFPRLAQMARVFLSVPASTAASERVFSYGSITIQQRRHSLQIDRVAKLMWMNKNMSLFEQLCN